jgi:DNA (cytosine-5)-methyltransferase 1
MTNDLTHLDLFSGIGGFALACRWAGVRTVAFAEVNPFACRVLQKHWPEVPNLGDIRQADFGQFCGVWLLTAGVPCQPASLAGKRRGASDDRWLWPQTLEITAAVAPRWIIFENVPGLLTLGSGMEFECLLSVLETLSYEVWPLVIPACAVGAAHRRNRVWIVAHADGTQSDKDQRRLSKLVALPAAHSEGQRIERDLEGAEAAKRSEGAAEPNSVRQVVAPSAPPPQAESRCDAGECATQPGFRGVDDGIPGWLDGHPAPVCGKTSHRRQRIAGLGNSIVPQVALRIIRAMICSSACL